MKVSVVGLGAMGAGIAANLHKAGLLYKAWNRTSQYGLDAAMHFGFPFESSFEVAVTMADVVITCVSADADLIEISDQLTSVMHAGSVLIDTSTVSSQTAILVAKQMEDLGVHFLDAPVSGGKEGAEKGTMVMMIGGDVEVINQMSPILNAISSKAIHMGPVGSGQSTKAVNQLMAAGINQAVTEALSFAVKQGLDTDLVIDVIQRGAADNWFLRHRGQSMCEGSFDAGFKVSLHQKDLKICQQMLDNDTSSVVTQTLSDYQKLIELGCGDEDISSLFKVK